MPLDGKRGVGVTGSDVSIVISAPKESRYLYSAEFYNNTNPCVANIYIRDNPNAGAASAMALKGLTFLPTKTGLTWTGKIPWTNPMQLIAICKDSIDADSLLLTYLYDVK